MKLCRLTYHFQLSISNLLWVYFHVIQLESKRNVCSLTLYSISFFHLFFFILLCSYLGVFNLHVDFPVGVHIMTFARVDTISLIL